MQIPVHSFINISLMPFFTSFLPKIGFFLEIIWYSQRENGILTTSAFAPLQMFSVILGDWIFHFSASSFFTDKKAQQWQLFAELLRFTVVITVFFAVISFSITNSLSSLFFDNSTNFDVSQDSTKFGYFVSCSLVLHVIAQFFLSYFTVYQSFIPSLIPFISITLQHVILIPVSFYLVGISCIYIPLFTVLCDALTIIVSIAVLRYYDTDFHFSFSSLIIPPSSEFIKLLLGNISGLLSCFFNVVFYYLLLYYSKNALLHNSEAMIQAVHAILRIVFLFESPAYSLRFPVFKSESLLYREWNFHNIAVVAIVAFSLCFIYYFLLLPIIMILETQIFEQLFYKSDAAGKALEYSKKLYSFPLYSVWLIGIYIPFANVLASVKTKLSFVVELSKSLLILIFGIYFIFTNNADQERMMYSFIASDVSTFVIAFIIGMPFLSRCFHLKARTSDDKLGF